jgi:hypothetical protein
VKLKNMRAAASQRNKNNPNNNNENANLVEVEYVEEFHDDIDCAADLEFKIIFEVHSIDTNKIK